MKTKVKITYEFIVNHDDDAKLKKAKAELKKRPVFEAWYGSGFSIKRLKTKGAIQS